MRPLQREAIARALDAAEPFGFALAGGLALTALGISDRPSDDGDLFTDTTSSHTFDGVCCTDR